MPVGYVDAEKCPLPSGYLYSNGIQGTVDQTFVTKKSLLLTACQQQAIRLFPVNAEGLF